MATKIKFPLLKKQIPVPEVKAKRSMNDKEFKAFEALAKRVRKDLYEEGRISAEDYAEAEREEHENRNFYQLSDKS